MVPVRSPTLPPATHTNAWVLGEKRVTIIDPAGLWSAEQQALADALADVEVAGIFLTHHHPDHIGGAEDLRRRTSAPIIAHAHTAAMVDFPVDEIVDAGAVLETDAGQWLAMHTPGHARGHLCLRRESGHMIAGDMVAGVGTIVLDPPEGHLADYLASLATMRRLKPSVLLPAHGPEITDAVAYLQHYIDHRHARTAQIRAALATQAATIQALVPIIYPDIPAFIHPVAARQVLCHLQWLAAAGEVVEDGGSWRTCAS